MDLKQIGYYNGTSVYETTRSNFNKNYNFLTHKAYYLIDNKYLVDFEMDEPVVIGQLEPDGTIFEYVSSTPFYKDKKNKNKYNKKDCSVKADVEYKVEENNLENLESLSAKVDLFLNESMNKDYYKELLFNKEFE